MLRLYGHLESASVPAALHWALLDLAAGRAGTQAASGFSSVPPVNNLVLVGDKPFKIYKPTNQNPNSAL